MFWASSSVYTLCFMQSLGGAVVFLADSIASTKVRKSKARLEKTTTAYLQGKTINTSPAFWVAVDF